VLSQPDSARANSVHTDQVLELMYRLMEYRHQEIRHRLEKVGRAASMLHLDVLLLIYHFAKVAKGDVLEIGPYIGGSTIAAAMGARESGRAKRIISIEPGGRLKHFSLPTKNIFKDLRASR
jgi:predicted O-methyltransferase YrrM